MFSKLETDLKIIHNCLIEQMQHMYTHKEKSIVINKKYIPFRYW